MTEGQRVIGEGRLMSSRGGAMRSSGGAIGSRGRAIRSRGRLALVALAGALAFALAGAAPASAETAWWGIYAEAGPTHLPPGGEGHINVEVGDLGDREVNATKEAVKLRDLLPAGVTAVSVAAFKDSSSVKCPSGPPPAPLECTFSGTLHPYEQFAIQIKVKVDEPAGTVASLPDQVTVEGGGAPSATSTQQLTVSPEPTPFGTSLFELTPTEEDGAPATQAGAHPFQLTTTVVTNQAGGTQPVALPKDLRFTLPPGLVGNPTAVPRCSLAEFYRVIGEVDLCPAETAVGVATVTAYEPKFGLIPKTVPVFNLEPSHGEPARFGFYVIGKIPIVIDTSVQTGGDYAVVASVNNVTQVAGLLSSQVTLWGVPGDPRHNAERGWECVAGGEFSKQIEKPCPSTSQLPQTPFLTLPSSCQTSPSAEPVIATSETDSWSEPGHYLGSEYAWMNGEGQPLGFEGCGALPFGPTLEVAPEQHTASTPSGVNVTVQVPQSTTLQADDLAEADVRDTTVTLPEGVQLSPSAANGLEACPEGPEGGYEGIGFEGFKKFAGPGLEAQAETQTFTPTFRFVQEESEGRALLPSCPEGSKLGTVEIETPLLPGKLKGYLYLASPAPNGEAGRNPFDSLVALYLVAEDSEAGVLVKLAGEGELNEGTLRVATTFRDAPQLPFSALKIHLFGGARAPLATPARCGSYGTEAVFTPWSGAGAVDVSSPSAEFAIGAGAEGSPCPGAALAFAPSLAAQSQSAQAGAFTSFGLELTRPGGDQALSGLTLHMPDGVAALLSAVELCGEAQASASACPASSEIGTATAVAGLGGEPYVETGGKVFITGPYDGAPFGLEIVTPAVAGPFNLGFVTVRSKITVDPENASITIDTPSLPTQLRGIPLQLGRVLVSIDRPDFEFNPTNCAQAHVEGEVNGSEGASQGVSAPFRVENCQSLPFAPTLTASTNGRATKADGTDFVVKVTSGGTDSSGVAQANIAKVDLQLPLQLPARLSTLQKACTEKAFDANPGSCPEGSVIGAATIHTPVLKSALAGPAYLVSHGNAAFPDVEFVLQGEGITLVLDGKTQIKNGITYSKFESAPDAPFTTFETVLPAGPHSALTANVPAKDDYDLCGQSLQMPTTITGQNGKVIEQDTRIAVQGCGQVKSAKAKKLTRAQKLANALAACRKKYRHAKAKRQKCEARARKLYRSAKKSKSAREKTKK